MIVIIELLVIVVTSIWVAYDAHKNKLSIDGKKYAWNNGWFAWLLSCVALWIVSFPYYIFRRFFKKTSKSVTTPISNNWLFLAYIFSPASFIYPVALLFIAFGVYLIYRKDKANGVAFIVISMVFGLLGISLFGPLWVQRLFPY
jgi:hypothetical protein